MSRLALLMCAALALSGCAERTQPYYQGYVEGELVYVASPLGGNLLELSVTKGGAVAAGAPLFALDPNPEALQVEETEQRIRQARARLADLEKGVRPSELAALEARLTSARAAMQSAERNHERRQELRDSGHTDAVSEEELDSFRADRDVRRAEVAGLEAELETARLGGRSDALEAARGEVDALGSALEVLRWQIAQKAPVAPSAGSIQETLYRRGEYVPAGRPVMAVLSPENLKVRFFVPQAVLSTIGLGQRVEVQLDGVAQRLPARVSFLSAEAEFTPPVIYSRESREKLVFLLEAVLESDALEKLRPGQPVEVYLEGADS